MDSYFVSVAYKENSLLVKVMSDFANVSLTTELSHHHTFTSPIVRAIYFQLCRLSTFFLSTSLQNVTPSCTILAVFNINYVSLIEKYILVCQ